MGIIILPFFILSLILTGILLNRLIKQVSLKKDYKIILFGFLISMVEIFFMLLYWQQQTEIYKFSPFIGYLSFLIILPSMIAFIIPLPVDTMAQKVGLTISASIVISFTLLMFYTFILSNFFDIFSLLRMNTYY